MKTVFTVLAACCFGYAIIVRVDAGFIKRVAVPWLILAVIFFGLSVFWQWMPEWARWALLVLLLLAVLVYVRIALRLIRTIRESKKDRPMKNLIVLGAWVCGRKPCGALKMRLEGALERMQTHPEARLIVSGGKGNDEDFPEAEVMEEYLRKNGGGDYEIIREDRSANTYENLKFSGEIIGSLTEETGIVSNSWHLYRAMELARKLGYTKAFPVFGASGKVTYFHYFSREVFAVFIQELNRRLGRYPESPKQ